MDKEVRKSSAPIDMAFLGEEIGKLGFDLMRLPMKEEKIREELKKAAAGLK